MSPEPSRSPRGRRTALLCAGAAAAVLALAGIACYPLALELYWIRELRRFEAVDATRSIEDSTGLAPGVQLTAAIRRLEDMRSVRAVPDLLRIFGTLWPPGPVPAQWKTEFQSALAARSALQTLPGIDGVLLHHAKNGETPAERGAAVSLLGSRGSLEAIPYLEWLDETDAELGPTAGLSLAQLLPCVEVEVAVELPMRRTPRPGFRVVFKFWNPSRHRLWYGRSTIEPEASYGRRRGEIWPAAADGFVGPKESVRFSLGQGAVPPDGPSRAGLQLFSHGTSVGSEHMGTFVWSPPIDPPATAPQ